MTDPLTPDQESTPLPDTSDTRAVIELTSSTVPPGQTRTKDDRTLGIRLRQLILKGG